MKRTQVSLDDITDEKIKSASAQLGIPKSSVIARIVANYYYFKDNASIGICGDDYAQNKLSVELKIGEDLYKGKLDKQP